MTQTDSASPKLTPEAYLDALPADLRQAVVGILAIKVLFAAAAKAQPTRKREYEMHSTVVLQAILGNSPEEYFDALMNHVSILTQLIAEQADDAS